VGVAIEWEIVEILQGLLAPGGGHNPLSDIAPQHLGYLHVQEVWYVKQLWTRRFLRFDNILDGFENVYLAKSAHAWDKSAMLG
jgi:hypothetical protein